MNNGTTSKIMVKYNIMFLPHLHIQDRLSAHILKNFFLPSLHIQERFSAPIRNFYLSLAIFLLLATGLF